MNDPAPKRPHDNAEWFREAVKLTVERLSYSPRLIEKDYFCTIMLEYLAAAEPALVFKGGTCLAKVHLGFYRLSEDLDFVIPIARDASRGERKRLAAKVKQAVAALSERLPIFRLLEPWQGANNSTHYTATAGYVSPFDGHEEPIEIEIGLREPLLHSPVISAAQTMLLDPVTGQALMPPLELNCLGKTEAFAEKFRAALSRRDPAIRDFYDLDHATRTGNVQPADAELINLVRQKLAVPGNDATDVSANRLAALRRQLESELRPVVRDREFEQFDLDRAFAIVAAMAEIVK
jgi:predicted nucleotidyltransferase component of viral defense system